MGDAHTDKVNKVDPTNKARACKDRIIRKTGAGNQLIRLGRNWNTKHMGPVYTWSLHAFSLIGYLSDLVKHFHLHLAT